MDSTQIATTLATLFRELIDGVPREPSYMLNTGDVGLLGSIEKLSADDASRTSLGGASIAAHVDHLRYGLALMNQWKSGVKNPWAGADWTASWKISRVTDAEWDRLRRELKTETHQWLDALGAARAMDETQLTYMIASIAHLAYHVGAVRQIDRAARGPTAEAEAEAKRASRQGA
jgi:hypothetical protein